MPEEILDFWFSKRVTALHFAKDSAFDIEIKAEFLKAYQQAADGKLEKWQESALGSLALVIMLDQFPRNMFRDTPNAFATDEYALYVAKQAIEKRLDKELSKDQRMFLYMPFMHSEDLQIQEESVKLFEGMKRPDNIDYAIAHRDIIKEFGRFPHRNKILWRKSTPEEFEFLKQPGSGF